MRLETPTQVVMSKVNRGNIHTFFFYAGYSICKKRLGKLLLSLWEWCGCTASSWELCFKTQVYQYPKDRVTEQVLCAHHGADISNVLIPGVLEDHQHITPQLPFQPSGTADSIIPGTAFMLELRISTSRATFQKKTSPLNYVAKDTANIPSASK